MKDETELTLVDRQLIHQYRNNRAQLRRKRLGVKQRARLEVVQPELEAASKERGIAEWLPGWRAYPSREKPDIHGFRVGVRFESDGAMVVESSPPAEVERKRRDYKPAERSGGEAMDSLLDQLERSLE